MSELDKMMAFGHWLSERRAQLNGELIQMSTQAKYPEASVRVKAGHVEAFSMVLIAFKDLYDGELNKFMKEYLGQEPEDEEESDGADVS